MKNRPLSAWWRKQKGIRECKAWLKHDNADAIAAKALFHLNRGAKGNIHSKTIYALKNLVIRHFYERGFCTSVTASKQDLICFRCGGDGEDPEGWEWAGRTECERCGGSGIYNTVYLYDFTFDIGGQRYQWHQPQELVNWPVATTSDELLEYKGAQHSEFLPDIALSHYLVTLYAYLLINGIDDIPERLTFREALRTSIRWYWQKHYSYAYPKPLHLKVIAATIEWYKTRGKTNDYAEIPF